MSLVALDALTPYAARYAAREPTMRPLRVTVHLVPPGRVGGYDPIALDNLLARCVVMEACGGSALAEPDGALGYVLPVPLRCLWRSADGVPLWAATPLMPEGETITDSEYWHKRTQPGTLTWSKSGRYSVNARTGRFMERRVPLPVTTARTWRAEVIGDAAEIARLLAPLTHIGKKRAMGLGEVERWTITPLDAFQLVRDERLTRPLPAAAVALLDGALPVDPPAPIGWTPPQWRPALFLDGWPAGARVRRGEAHA